MDRDLIKENCEKYYAAKNKAQDQSAGGDSNRNKNKKWNGKKKDADPVSSKRKKWMAAGI